MSGLRRARNINRAAPFRESRRTRPSASGPGDRICKAPDVAIYFREDCRTLEDSLQLEMVVAQYLLQIRDVRSPEGVPVGDAVAAGVVAWLESEGDDLSHAILRGVAHLATGDTATRSARAVRRLEGRGVGLPERFADVGEARALGAWRATEGGFPGQYCLFAEFEHPTGRRHSLALFVERRRCGGVVKHLGLLGPMSELEGDGPFHPDAMAPIAAPEAGALLRELLERTHGTDGADSDDFRVQIAAARARSMAA